MMKTMMTSAVLAMSMLQSEAGIVGPSTMMPPSKSGVDGYDGPFYGIAVNGHNAKTYYGYDQQKCASMCNANSWCKGFELKVETDECRLQDGDSPVIDATPHGTFTLFLRKAPSNDIPGATKGYVPDTAKGGDATKGYVPDTAKGGDACRTVIYETVKCNEYTKRATKEVVVYDVDQVCEKKEVSEQVVLDLDVRRDACDFEVVANDVVTRIPSFVKDCSESNANGSCGIKTEITEVITQDVLCDWECSPAYMTAMTSTELPYYVTECIPVQVERWVSVPVEVTEKVCHVVEKEYGVCSPSDSSELARLFEESVATYQSDPQNTAYITLAK